MFGKVDKINGQVERHLVNMFFYSLVEAVEKLTTHFGGRDTPKK